MTSPFTYPGAPQARRHGPRGYADHESYRPWLRDEFAFRCVYCLFREMWGPLNGVYVIDHFQPIAFRPDLRLDYDNLVYGCAACNLSKGSQEAPEPFACLVDPDITVSQNGEILAATPQAQKLVELLRLNRARMREIRALWIRIIHLAELHDAPLYQRLLGYPPNLPDLSILRPPEGNARPEGIAMSHLARRERGELPEIY